VPVYLLKYINIIVINTDYEAGKFVANLFECKLI